MSEPTPTASWPATPFAITLFVDDVAAAREFYARAFGLAVAFEDETSAVFRFGATMINLLHTSSAPELIEPAQAAPSAAGARLVITLQVDDVDELCGQLVERGVVLLNGPMDRPWGPRTASFSDPFGHIWELAR